MHPICGSGMLVELAALWWIAPKYMGPWVSSGSMITAQADLSGVSGTKELSV